MNEGHKRHHETSRMVHDALNQKQTPKEEEPKRTPDQAEGERDESKKNLPQVGRTPGSAEGDRETVEEDLRQKGR